MSAPTRQSAARIGLEPEVNPGTGHREPNHNKPNQIDGRRAFAATDTGSCWPDHVKVYPARSRPAYPVSFPPRPHPGP